MTKKAMRAELSSIHRKIRDENKILQGALDGTVHRVVAEACGKRIVALMSRAEDLNTELLNDFERRAS